MLPLVCDALLLVLAQVPVLLLRRLKQRVCGVRPWRRGLGLSQQLPAVQAGAGAVSGEVQVQGHARSLHFYLGRGTRGIGGTGSMSA